MFVGRDLECSNSQLQAITETVAQEDEAPGIAKRQGPQESAFNEREDGSGRTDAYCESEHDGQGKAGRFQKLAECEGKVTHTQVSMFSQRQQMDFRFSSIREASTEWQIFSAADPKCQ